VNKYSMKFIKLLSVVMLVLMSGCTPSSPQARFWQWFVANEDKLLHFESSPETTLNNLSTELGKVDRNLNFEFSSLRSDGTRDFIISASGIVKTFPAVESLYSSAPKLPKWKFVKYRQRKPQIFDIVYSGKSVAAKDVRFVLVPDNKVQKFGIIIIFKDYSDRDRRFWQETAFIFLDMAIGEHDVAMKVGKIDVNGIKSQVSSHSKPIPELAHDFDTAINH
jgi:hypothetical protein